MEQEKKLFGHPVGLMTLFFTEMWERFSYYGMRALLVLFMTTPLLGANPGMGLGVGNASAIYGLYTASVYFLTLAGGWVADNLWGQRKAVFVGGCIIAAGHFSMAIEGNVSFFTGLVLIAIGTGLLKPNVSTMVGELYPEGGARRDAGFSIFYMGINLGAFLGPIICGALGENWNWHAGFSAAGVGMVLGLIQYKAGSKLLGNAGLLDEDTASPQFKRKNRNFYIVTTVVILLLALFGFLVNQGVFPLSMEDIATGLGYGILILVLLYFLFLFIAGGHSGTEKKRLGVIFWLFILAAIFWSGFEQAGSSLNLFADQNTNRIIGGWQVPASWLQSINPIFIILLAPVFGWLWTYLAARNSNPSAPLKFALGLIGLSAGFFVISWGAANSGPGNLASPAWLIVTYFLHTCGELCLSPVGLSSVTKLAPKNRVGQMMGIWFVAAALGNLFAGLLSGQLEELDSQALFSKVALFIGSAGIIALLASPFVRKLMGDVK